jgi:hypothetical protein
MHYAPDGRGDVLDTVYIRMSDCQTPLISNSLDSGHLPVMFKILGPAGKREALDPVEKLTD